ncbi:hypothetical protein MUO14_08090 [Halobacillus shinanisalinarum]|uniref:Uncharacterized protein n=1 Tax=Halobacillus shinanisalinarum TaxID=2932258 RepID=A0ABY4H443_9BACI|nr:hypothetical protein [Halobacillus shinanisalinarum]UOQ94875.1 hypothetical protein MUO14_08090 [Halobacillus shinanisalinarum]
MEKQGYVSLWIGNIQDFLPSPFLNDFAIDIDDFDEDFFEKVIPKLEK